jgi:hypothetical protein
MTGTHGTNGSEHGTDGPAGPSAGPANSEDAVTVEWDVRPSRRLRRLGLAGSVTGVVDVVVVDRRGGETTPGRPGELTVDGRRVLVLPDRAVGAPRVELWVAGPRERYERVVRTLRRTVELDARVDAAFEAARRRHRRGRGPDGLSTDGGRATPPVGSVLEGFDGPAVSLAVGGFAAAVDPVG